MQESQFSPDGARLCAITASIPAASTLFGLMRGLRDRFTTKDCKEEGSCGKLNVNTLLWSLTRDTYKTYLTVLPFCV